MSSLGLIECFYGRPWTPAIREFYASFLKEIGFSFYLYGPKSDVRLRKFWRQPLTSADRDWFRSMQRSFASKGLRFGLILSPHGLFNKYDAGEISKLKERVKELSDLGIDDLGLFFDDMKSAPEMAERQLEIVSLVQSQTRARIIFCPSYYSTDSLLDMLFGDRPANYLETLGKGLSPDVDVIWTGEEVISKEISAEHLRAIATVLKRKPFLCDNFYTNDTPINSHFLQVLPPTGRARNVFEEARGWAFNPMNPPHLSQIVLLAISHYLKGMAPEQAFRDSITGLCSATTAEFILANHRRFSEDGLDPLSGDEKFKLRGQLGALGPVETELVEWLGGRYVVEFEEMIDQSCYDSP